jgi:hypothetical protein
MLEKLLIAPAVPTQAWPHSEFRSLLELSVWGARQMRTNMPLPPPSSFTSPAMTECEQRSHLLVVSLQLSDGLMR